VTGTFSAAIREIAAVFVRAALHSGARSSRPDGTATAEKLPE
jgi:hypothetical protein